eukprot:m.17726 g.17726  ORF g.17726 m.17726 type:complete len:361 (-) comp6094_c0_seq1:121-1203(-)
MGNKESRLKRNPSLITISNSSFFPRRGNKGLVTKSHGVQNNASSTIPEEEGGVNVNVEIPETVSLEEGFKILMEVVSNCNGPLERRLDAARQLQAMIQDEEGLALIRGTKSIMRIVNLLMDPEVVLHACLLITGLLSNADANAIRDELINARFLGIISQSLVFHARSSSITTNMLTALRNFALGGVKYKDEIAYNNDLMRSICRCMPRGATGVQYAATTLLAELCSGVLCETDGNDDRIILKHNRRIMHLMQYNLHFMFTLVLGNVLQDTVISALQGLLCLCEASDGYKRLIFQENVHDALMCLPSGDARLDGLVNKILKSLQNLQDEKAQLENLSVETPPRGDVRKDSKTARALRFDEL